HHAAGVAVPRVDRAPPLDLPGAVLDPAVPVRGHGDPDHRRGGARDHETAGVPAAHAPLRGLPEVRPVRIVLFGPPGAGKGTQAHRLADRMDLALIATGDIFRANVANDTELGREAKAYMDR